MGAFFNVLALAAHFRTVNKICPNDTDWLKLSKFQPIGTVSNSMKKGKYYIKSRLNVRFTTSFQMKDPFRQQWWRQCRILLM
jgi:hypothetical protein